MRSLTFSFFFLAFFLLSLVVSTTGLAGADVVECLVSGEIEDFEDNVDQFTDQNKKLFGGTEETGDDVFTAAKSVVQSSWIFRMLTAPIDLIGRPVSCMHVPLNVTRVFVVLMILSFIIGLIQLVSGRNFKSME